MVKPPMGKTAPIGVVVTSTGKPGKPFGQESSHDYLLKSHLRPPSYRHGRKGGSHRLQSTATTPRSPCPNDSHRMRPRLGTLHRRPSPTPRSSFGAPRGPSLAPAATNAVKHTYGRTEARSDEAAYRPEEED
jgi:hypothetical protein